MSLDQRGRDAGLAVRRAAERRADVPRGLIDVRRRAHRQQVTARTTTVLVLLAVVAATMLVVRGGVLRSAPPPPVDHRQRCAAALCQGQGEFVVDLRAPVVWTMPRGWEQHLAANAVSARPTGSTGRSPVVVLEDVRGGDYGSQAQDPTDAATVATWVQGTPGLGVTDVQRTTLAGRPAIRMTVTPTGGYLLFGTKRAIPVEDQLDETWFAAQEAFDISGYLGKDKVYVATPGSATDVWLLDVDGTTTAVVAPRSADATVTSAQRSILSSMSFER